MKAWTIVGYTFRTDNYCPRHVIDALPTGPGEAFDGWALAPGVHMTTEDNLSELAAAFGIDRTDEYSYDSGDFPKVIFASQVESDDDTCVTCGEPLV